MMWSWLLAPVALSSPPFLGPRRVLGPSIVDKDGLPEEIVLPTPELEGELIMERLKEQAKRVRRYPLSSSEVSTRQGEEVDARAALLSSAVPIQRHNHILQQYQLWMKHYRDPARAADHPFPEELPAEFRLYREAIGWMHADQVQRALSELRALLSLPPSERLFRSTWAAYMIGNLEWTLRNYPAAWEAYREVRLMAEAGLVDSLGLALVSHARQASLPPPDSDATPGQEAFRSLQLYLLYITHAKHFSPDSIRPRAAGKLLLGDREGLADAAGDPLVSTVLSAYLLRRERADRKQVEKLQPSLKDSSQEEIQRWMTQRWLELTMEQGAPSSSADWMAWLAYEEGEYALSRDWLQRARPSPVETWVRSRVQLQEGAVEAAIQTLSAQPERPYTLERGRLLILADRYLEAALAFLEGGSWIDLAWTLENLLTPEELSRFLEHLEAEAESDSTEEADGASRERAADSPSQYSEAMVRDLRYLIGRRKVREGDLASAQALFPPDQQALLEDYLQVSRSLETLQGVERGRALWAMAQLEFAQGMELRGTETAPDFNYYRGNFSLSSVREHRLQEAISDQERARLSSNPLPTRRFHYRYLAAERAWEAAELLEEDSEELAQALCQAGSWLENDEPEAADRYYKALVRRAGKTELGAYADQIRWFPRVDSEQDGRCVIDPLPEGEEGSAGCLQGARSSASLSLTGLLLVLLARRRRGAEERALP